jgi:hypothetical protein
MSLEGDTHLSQEISSRFTSLQRPKIGQLAHLPEHVDRIVRMFLASNSPRGLVPLAMTCKGSFQMFRDDNVLWNQLCLARWPCFVDVPIPLSRAHYKANVSPKARLKNVHNNALEANQTIVLVTISTRVSPNLDHTVIFSEAASFGKMNQHHIELRGAIQCKDLKDAIVEHCLQGELDVHIWDRTGSKYRVLLAKHTGHTLTCYTISSNTDVSGLGCDYDRSVELRFQSNSEKNKQIQISVHHKANQSSCTVTLEALVSQCSVDGIYSRPSGCAEFLHGLSSASWSDLNVNLRCSP